MSTDRVLIDLQGGLLTLTLNRPEKRNALDRATIDALHAAVRDADVETSVDVVALRGAGDDFCAGADLRELLDSADQDLALLEADARRLGDVFVAMRRLPKPVVAVVHGCALAGGCGLATACDLVVADANAQFGYPEIRRGFVPAMVMAMLRRAVGERVAFDLVATGRILKAEDARAIGLVSRVIPTAQFNTTVDALLRELGSASSSALALIKQQLHAVEGLGFEEAIALGARVNAVARGTPDFRRAVEQFFADKQ